MRNLILVMGIFIGFFCIISFPQKADAHIYQTDRNISAELHLTPAHQVVAGSSSEAIMEFDDSTNKLDLTSCECMISISINGSSTYSTKLGADPLVKFSQKNIDFFYTFPIEGIYSMVVKGNPKASSTFQSFRLAFSVPVMPAGTKVIGGSDDGDAMDMQYAPHSMASHLLAGHSIHIVLFGGAILICIYIVIRDKRRLKNAKRK